MMQIHRIYKSIKSTCPILSLLVQRERTLISSHLQTCILSIPPPSRFSDQFNSPRLYHLCLLCCHILLSNNDHTWHFLISVSASPMTFSAKNGLDRKRHPSHSEALHSPLSYIAFCVYLLCKPVSADAPFSFPPILVPLTSYFTRPVFLAPSLTLFSLFISGICTDTKFLVSAFTLAERKIRPSRIGA